MRSKQDILDQLYQLVSPYCKQPMELEEGSSLIEEVGLDSMKVMDLVMQIEDHFDISVPLNILPDVRTIGDFAEKLHQLMQER